MPVIKITPADVLKGQLLPEGWYGLTIKHVSDWAKAKNSNSMNVTVTFTVDKTEGKELQYWVNSNSLGMNMPLFNAMAGKKLEPAEIEVDTSTWIGKKLDGKIVQDTFNGNMNNKIADFLPSGMG